MSAVSELRAAANLLRRQGKIPQADQLYRVASNWTSGTQQVEQDALRNARTILRNAQLPEHIAVMVRRGHHMEPDSPIHSATARWTCTRCGDAVLDSGTVVYGAATKRACGRRSGGAR
jgi:hypothetical protein